MFIAQVFPVSASIPTPFTFELVVKSFKDHYSFLFYPVQPKDACSMTVIHLVLFQFKAELGKGAVDEVSDRLTPSRRFR